MGIKTLFFRVDNLYHNNRDIITEQLRMKKLLSIIMIIALVFPNAGLLANAQTRVPTFEESLHLYRIFPNSFAQKINEYVAAAENYIIASPAADSKELAVLRQSLKESEEHIVKVLGRTLKEEEFIYDVYRTLSYTEGPAVQRNRLSLIYTKETVSALAAGKTPMSAVNVLKAQPNFFNKAAFTMLARGEKDFASLVGNIQRQLALNRSRAVSLALSAEVEYARSITGGRIQALREQIAHNKFMIRRSGLRRG